MTTTIEQATQALRAAVAAGEAAALAVWDRDEHQDRGSCGGAMLEFDGRTIVAKAAEQLGIVYRSGKEYWLRLDMPAGIRSQNLDIPEAQFRAFRVSLEAAGLGSAIKRAWSYVD